jgi:hypothetical protein
MKRGCDSIAWDGKKEKPSIGEVLVRASWGAAMLRPYTIEALIDRRQAVQ